MAEVGFNLFPAIAAAFPGIIADIVNQTADECVTNIQDVIRANGQIDTGAMLAGITKENGGDDQTKNIMSAEYYWKFQNFGTRFMPARPFVEPGVAATNPGFVGRLAGVESRLP